MANKRLLFVTEGSILAHVGRCLSVAEHLESEPLEVSFAADGRHASHLSAAGYTVHPVFTRPREETLAKLRTGGSAFEEGMVRAYVEAEIALLRQVQPSLVVGDFRPTLSISAPVVGVPYVSLVNAVWTPYCDIALDPPESWRPTKFFGKRLLRRLTPYLEKSVFRHYAKPFNRVRRFYGLPPSGDLRECFCSADLTLVVDLPEFFGLRDAPPHFRTVGPVLWEPEVPAPDWIGDLDRNETIVYVSMGSTGPQDLVGEIIASLLNLGCQVVATGDPESLGFGDDSRGVFAAPFLPGRRVCDLADVVVCHAGNGTIYQALAHGTPVVGLPEFHDQEFNMQRVEELNLGRRLSRRGGIGRDASAAVEKIQQDQECRRAVGRFSDLLEKAEGARTAAHEILGMLG